MINHPQESKSCDLYPKASINLQNNVDNDHCQSQSKAKNLINLHCWFAGISREIHFFFIVLILYFHHTCFMQMVKEKKCKNCFSRHLNWNLCEILLGNMLIIYKQLFAYFMQRVTSEQVLLYTLPGTLIEMYCRWDFAGGKEQGEPPVQDMLVSSDPCCANPAYLHWPGQV